MQVTAMRKIGDKFFRLNFGPLLAASAVVLVASAAFADVQAPNGSQAAQVLAQRIAADEVRLAQFQQKMTTAEKSAGAIQVADLFGESDEEKAARLAAQQHEQAQDASIATLNQRVSDIESTLQRLTGQMEELDHRVSELNSKIDRMQKDFDYKLCTVVGQQMGASAAPGDQNALPCPGSQESMA